MNQKSFLQPEKILTNNDFSVFILTKLDMHWENSLNLFNCLPPPPHPPPCPYPGAWTPVMHLLPLQAAILRNTFYQVTLLTAHHGTWYANILTSGGRWWWVMILLVFDDNGRRCVLYSHSQCLNALDLLQSSLRGKHTSPVSLSELRTRLV